MSIILKLSAKIICILTMLIAFPAYWIISTDVTFAQNQAEKPVAITLSIEKSNLVMGESANVIVTLQNTSIFTITNVNIGFQETFLKIQPKDAIVNNLSPHSGVQATYFLEAKAVGESNLVATIQYDWVDINTSEVHNVIENVTLLNIKVKNYWGIDWPNFTLPLAFGFLISILTSLVITSITWIREGHKQRNAVKGLVLAFLLTTERSISRKEDASLDIWNAIVTKGNYFVTLHKLAKLKKIPELTKKLSQFAGDVNHYNGLNKDSNLDKVQTSLSTSIQELLQAIDKL